jgi:MoaA/NifB/PqqE/SkfB family radical SAM enzyme
MERIMSVTLTPQIARFDYLRKLFQSDLRPALREYMSGTLKGPLLIEFDPTTACNYSCPECISAGLLNKDHIPAHTIDRLLREFVRAGTKGIIFIGGGEPLAHAAMPRPLELAFELGLKVGLTTNGSLLDRHMEAIGRCVSWTRVSVDAASAETYALFRPNRIRDSFNKVVRNMEALARRKEGALGYSFLVVQRPRERQYATFSDSPDKLVAVESLRRNTPDRQEYVTNAHELFAAARLAREIGCDYFEFKPMVDPTHYLLAFDEPLRCLIGEQHARSLELETETFKIIAPRSIEYLRQRDDPVEAKTYSQCPAMELRTLVTPSGIYPCPYHRGREDKRLATLDVVANGSFEEFWASDARRDAMRKTNPSCDCQFYCIRHPTNLALHGLKTLQDAGVPLLDHIQEYDGLDDPFF